MNSEPDNPQTDHGVQGGRFGCLLRSWVELTADEQKALLTVLALFLLGLAARLWHLHG